MCGVLIGCLIAGHLGDHIGRKPTFYLAISVLIVFNVVAIFPVNWQLYAAVRFVLGMGKLLIFVSEPGSRNSDLLQRGIGREFGVVYLFLEIWIGIWYKFCQELP